jgi:hypothetical protein
VRTVTGNEPFNGQITIRIVGEQGMVHMPLSTSKTGQVPFQSKATDEFACNMANVGRIERVIIEHENVSETNRLHWKKLQIFKGNENYE